MTEAKMVDQPYCTGDRCGDCTPGEECCEATCGCCYVRPLTADARVRLRPARVTLDA